MSVRSAQYWAFCANPLYYRIVDAVRECEFDSWRIPRGEVRKGDRVLIWKAKGRDNQRGIVALAEVLTDPAPGLDPNRPYWIDPRKRDEPLPRVKVRYVVPPALPLWLVEGTPNVLGRLTVAHASGGSVFTMTPEQWAEVFELVGGWPNEVPELREAAAALAEVAGSRQVGQGYQTNPAIRQAIEAHAMQQAKAHFEELGWDVFDVSSTQPYDLYCLKSDGAELRVEVKGTTTEGAQVLLTRNEVQHARAHYPGVALFILAHVLIENATTGGYRASGGHAIIYQPWAVDDAQLTPLAYAYVPSLH